MFRHYEYKGYVVSVAVEMRSRVLRRKPFDESFTAVVQVASARACTPLTEPLRLAGRTGTPFRSEADALMGGYTAGQLLIDKLLCAPN
jgi:hypothetical protein